MKGEKTLVHSAAPVRETLLPFHQPWMDAEDERAVVDTLRSGWLTKGPKTKAFEQAFASYVGAQHCIGLNSCTAALHLALEVAGVSAGDEVITTPITFASTVNVIVHRGARPVLVDVEDDTLNIDVGLLEQAISPRTKAIIPVDFAGHPCALDSIGQIAARHNLVTIEDAAHAVGAEYDGHRIGSISDMTCFSFYATKNITSGEGGALTTDNGEWAEKIEILSLHGITLDAWKRHHGTGYEHWAVTYPGYKYNMFDLQASLVLSQLSKIDSFWERRVELKKRFDSAFAGIPEIQCPVEKSNLKHAYHLYPIRIRPEMLTAERDAIMNAIVAENVGVGIHFRAVHLHPYYQNELGFQRGICPCAERYSDRTISLPFYPRMSDADADDVIGAVSKVIQRFRR